MEPYLLYVSHPLKLNARGTTSASSSDLPIMLKQARLSQMCRHSLPPLSGGKSLPPHMLLNFSTVLRAPTKRLQLAKRNLCKARRRLRYNSDDDEEYEEHGHNAKISMLESYSESFKDEVLLVRATVDGQEEEVLVFKANTQFNLYDRFKLSSNPKRFTDLSKSVLPARAVIKSIDRIKGPFNPANVEYIEKDLTWDAFKARHLQSQDNL